MALDTLSNMASLLLSTFATTVEEDRHLLAASSDTDLQLALRFRMEKKGVLLNAINVMGRKRRVRVMIGFCTLTLIDNVCSHQLRA
jgi:Rubisco LSMT substrate-binding